MPAAPSSKAMKLLAEGRVVPDTAPPPSLFWVDGDTPGSRYAVVVGAHVALCSCPSPRNDCSHVTAAAARVNASEGALALMDEALALRKARDAAEAEDLFARLGA